LATDMTLVQQLARNGAISRLAERFEGVFSRETIERFVEESLDQLKTSVVPQFVPLLAERFARERLEAFAKAEGLVTTSTPEVLFVCVHNAGRSQMAAGLLAKYAHGRLIVRSAGSAPAGEINPAVREAMAEVGVDLDQAYPKPLSDDFVRAADVVITMGCGDACPIYPGKRYEDWELDDPAGKTVEEVRPIRDQLDRRVRALLAQLLPADV
jgi:arsenate reductase (thioredoxin)